MDISAYRARHDLTREEFARMIGVSAEFVRLCEKGERRLSPDKAMHLEDATAGEISRHDTRPDLWPKPERASA